MKIKLYVNESSRRKLVREIRQKVEEQRKADGWIHVDAAGLAWREDEHGIFTNLDTFVGGIPSRLGNIDFVRVALYDEGSANEPVEGVYEGEGAEALVDSFHDGRRESWRIRILGDDFNSVVSLYKQIRTCTVEPVEMWKSPMHKAVDAFIEHLRNGEQGSEAAG